MPELPEVEVVRRGLEQHVVGRRIERVEVLHPRAVRRHVAGPAEFAAALAGARVTDVRRRGKYLWLPLDDEPDRAILGHLGMSGQLLLLAGYTPDGPHLRVRLTFDDGGLQLRFVDQRTFGGLAVSALGDDGVPVEIAHIAVDPLDAAFDASGFATALRRRRTGIKRALLDQTLISGVGNIYADEALWRAQLHYARPTATLRRAEIDRLVGAVREVMLAALAEGGTSFDQLYVNVNGESGYFDRSLQVYGREGEPCARCGAPVQREPFMNRSSHYCPRCQRNVEA
ncbi:bifunctional DNA-formamidopyrimidine glycosylase/DNA-(apurinic or apyrimidinic site) lyase [Phytoactinopolyspora limicola]|uniref:bifunctional DNA-formamidopyrimidine glycosylase/DNA-(apurinic or apyrimidinic site) lyase n=1 Tax=Phytoactinopolyspora limicola TaxID=2715536 RepID=UPI00140DCD16|nr:bifunctional DNA-formamidopyrimidine glycosylase/DNA-(apurinic or apyrimidinic site) lyase [Phytoactinopolyspora limicola]